MKLLICTQMVDKNDANLSAFHEWIAQFAARCEKVIVICLYEGKHTLPKNVEVISLGKEKKVSRLAYIRRFYKNIISRRHDYDAVFVHMNPEYIVLGGYFWRRWGKRIGLWYAHRSVTLKLRIAVHFADLIFTVSNASFRLRTEKCRMVGHGIDTELFKPDIRETSIDTRIVTTGRIAASKRLLEMLQVLDVLHAKGEKFRFTVIGTPLTSNDARYEKRLHEEVRKRPYQDRVQFVGSVPHQNLPAFLNQQDVFLNFSTTGNMDKAGLEALAMTVPVVTTNEAFKDLLEPFELYIGDPSVEKIAKSIDHIMDRPDRGAVVATLRNKVVEGHSLSRLVPVIVSLLS